MPFCPAAQIGQTDETLFMLFTFPTEKWDQLSSMTSCIIQDGSLHVCTFNKDLTGLESYFTIEILVKNCSPHELSISQ